MATGEHLRFAEFCDACRRYRYIGLCHGDPGLGKTFSAERYTQWKVVEATAALPCHPEQPRPIPPVLADCRTVFYTAEVVSHPSRVLKEVTLRRKLLTGLVHQARDCYGQATSDDDHVMDFTELLIVDEADRLTIQNLGAIPLK